MQFAVKDLLQRRLGINEETVYRVIPFNDPRSLSAQDKFDILLHIYKKRYGVQGLSELIAKNHLDKPIGAGAELHYRVTSQDIHELYARHSKDLERLDFYDYMLIVSQRIYQLTYGLGAIDEIRDMNVDGLNCGTSGIPNTFYMYGADARFGAEAGELPRTSYNAIWVMYRGKLIHFSFMGFRTQRELERVAKKVYRYDNPGTLDKATG